MSEGVHEKQRQGGCEREGARRKEGAREGGRENVMVYRGKGQQVECDTVTSE